MNTFLLLVAFQIALPGDGLANKTLEAAKQSTPAAKSQKQQAEENQKNMKAFYESRR